MSRWSHLVAFLPGVPALLACNAPSRGNAGIASASASALSTSAPVLAVFAKAPAGRPIDLVVKKNEIVPPRKWPNACELLTQEDIEAIFPGVTDIRQEKDGVESTTIEQFAVDPKDKDERYSPSGQCFYRFQLPGENHARSWVWVRIRAVADSDLTKRYYDGPLYLDYTIAASGGAKSAKNCNVTSMSEGNLLCLGGPVIFEIGGYGTASFKETEAFGIAMPFFWRDTVLHEFARAITAKLPEK
jgi:hypothetical protein